MICYVRKGERYYGKGFEWREVFWARETQGRHVLQLTERSEGALFDMYEAWHEERGEACRIIGRPSTAPR
jgi:hypothetical protein